MQTMKILAAVVLLATATGLAGAAQIFKWRDADGRWNYGNAPPEGVRTYPVTGDSQELAKVSVGAAQIFKWRDADGRWSYGNAPPEGVEAHPVTRDSQDEANAEVIIQSIGAGNLAEITIGMRYVEVNRLLGLPSEVIGAPKDGQGQVIFGQNRVYFANGAVSATRFPELGRRWDRSKVVPGMNSDDVVAVWGPPSKSNVFIDTNGEQVQMVYQTRQDAVRADSVYLRNGIVTNVEFGN